MNVTDQLEEVARLDALQNCHILDTPREGVYEDLVHLAAMVCGTPMSLISFIDRDRQWLKAQIGFELYASPREAAICAHTVTSPDGLLIVPDTLADVRFANNPFVRGNPYVRFYAGVAAYSSSGYALGTLCVLDVKPRILSPAQLTALQGLSRQLAAHLAKRRIVAELEREVVERQLAEVALREAQTERERLIDELQDALAQVKTLKGFLPICASCKNIRDDAGYWQQIESYLREHSELEFTHGICPQCATSLYPGYNASEPQKPTAEK